MAYRLELPPSLAAIHNVFHVSMMRKCLRDPEDAIPLSEVELRDDLTYVTRPIAIIERDMRVTRGGSIRKVKVRWSENEKDVTWELEDKMRGTHPELFVELDEAMHNNPTAHMFTVSYIPYS